jgi:hypothetical protein
MNGDNKFWVACWSLVAGVICTLILTIGGVIAYKANVLRELIAEQRVDPMRAACAMDIGERKDGVCSIIAASPVR